MKLILILYDNNSPTKALVICNTAAFEDAYSDNSDRKQFVPFML